MLGRGFLLSVHGPRWDPTAAHQLRMGIGPVLEQGAGLPAVGAQSTRSSTATSRSFDRIGDEIDESSRTQAIGRPDPGDARARVPAQARADPDPPRPGAEPRGVRPAHEPRVRPRSARRTVFYFRDVYDHLIRLNDELDTFRELIAGTLEIYLSTINNNLSDDHEAADRRDGDPRRHRRDRRGVRHERGGAARSAARSAAASGS